MKLSLNVCRIECNSIIKNDVTCVLSSIRINLCIVYLFSKEKLVHGSNLPKNLKLENPLHFPNTYALDKNIKKGFYFYFSDTIK